jgi:O-acetyl-ADP-ribose deacetylase (regulator of RNase III)
VAAGPGGIRLRKGDIVESPTDALVNAANTSLIAGGGVDGAIHRAAGPELQSALRRLHPQGCPTGQAVATPGFGIPVRFLIHAVGPVWRGGVEQEAELLGFAYRGAFRLAAELGCGSVAAPAISTGIYGFPLALAAPIAIVEARRALASPSGLEVVEFVLFDAGALACFARALGPG